jgi:hypothetical protein
MMATDNIAGHTAAQNTLGEDGLRDGDSLSPTTLTNILQSAQGNGIVRYQDGAYGSTRNETNSGNQPGSMVRTSASTITVSGGFAVLDGLLYEFGGGVGNTVVLDLNNGSHGTGGLQLSADEEAIYTIYVAPSGGNSKVHYEGGSPVDTTTGLYPSASNQYLIDYDTGATQDNMKTVVLAHVRVQFVSSGGGSNKIDVTEINDKRVFVSGAAKYHIPLSTGTISSGEIADGGAEGVNTVSHLNALLNENGELSTSDTLNPSWVSHPRYGSFNQSPPSSSDAGYGQGPSRGADRGGGHAADSFYFAGRNNEQTGHYSVRLQGMGVDATSTALTTSGTWVLTAEGDSFFMLSPNSGVTITLNPERDASANYKFPEGHMIEVCNEGDGSITFDNQTSPAGLNSTLSSGHRATFVYEGSVWIRCDYQSAIIGLPDPAIEISSGAPVFATGITKAEVLTLLNVEDGADVTDETNVKTALNGMTLTDVGTPASTDRILLQDASDSNNLKYADFSEFGGGGGGGDEIADADSDTKIQVEESSDEDKIRFDTAGSEAMIIDDSQRVGIGNSSPTNPLHVKNTTTLGDAAYVARFQAAEGNVAITRYGGIHLDNDNTSPTDGAAWDSDRWQISERDGGSLDIAHGTSTNTNVGAGDTILRCKTDGKVGVNLGSTDPTVELHVSGSGKFSSNLEIDGDLNHDGTKVGFFSTTPVVQTTVANLAASTIGARPASTPSGAGSFDPLMDVYIGQLESEISALRTKVDALLDALQSYGLV